MELEFISEFQIDSKTSKAINSLLTKCFPDIKFSGRDYFKQLPHHRILAIKDQRIIGQLAIDHRVMNLNGEPVNTFGVVDLCVDPEFQRQGIGTSLIKEFEEIAKSNSDKIDFLFLVSEDPDFYRSLGFTATKLTTSWLKIDQHRNLGVANEKIEDAFFLVKSINGKEWKDGDLDLLGYMF